MAEFHWTNQTEEAAQLVADGRLTDTEIAEKLDVTRQTIWHWRKKPEFAERVNEILARYREETERIGVAQKVHRLRRINETWLGLQRVIAARATDPDHMRAPGGDTGLLARTIKRIKNGDEPDSPMIDVDEFSVDTGLIKALLDHEKQAAQETGQWVDKSEADVTSAGRRVPIQIVKVLQPATRPTQD